MTDKLFFPKAPAESSNTQEYETLINQEFNKMHTFLHSEVGDRRVKAKLHDQLIWLQYQLRYFHRCQDLELLEKSYNWVVSNFNHDLSLAKDQAFELINKKSL